MISVIKVTKAIAWFIKWQQKKLHSSQSGRNEDPHLIISRYVGVKGLASETKFSREFSKQLSRAYSAIGMKLNGIHDSGYHWSILIYTFISV